MELRRARIGLVCLVAGWALTGCGLFSGDGGETPLPSPTGGGPPGAVTSLDGVEAAVIRVAAEGMFAEPQTHATTGAPGVGSGFIIDGTGIAVTSNHAVAGATQVNVWVGADQQPRVAQVLGRSECNDLAVIDLDGDNYSFLEWYAGELATGLAISVAGFAASDSTYAVTPGTLVALDARGLSPRGSVEVVLQHDAPADAGSFGGPLVTSDGKAIGVQYGTGATAGDQLAIAAPAALPVITTLRAGTDDAGIGINGEAFVASDGTSSGVWVASVQPGSPAADAGLVAGDIITELEQTPLAEDGTLADYCAILRSHQPDDVLAIEVLRRDSGEVLGGEVNGRPLVATVIFPDGGGSDDGSVPPPQYTTVHDDTGTLQMSVPTAWSDIDGTAWLVSNQPVGLAIRAAPDIDAFFDTWTTPGVFFGASRTLVSEFDEAALLAEFDFSEDCDYQGRRPYQDPAYTGLRDAYTNCGGEEAAITVVAAAPEERDFIVLVIIQAVNAADAQAGDQVLDTFFVPEEGQLP